MRTVDCYTCSEFDEKTCYCTELDACLAPVHDVLKQQICDQWRQRMPKSEDPYLEPIQVVATQDVDEFRNTCNLLCDEGYKLITSHIGIIENRYPLYTAVFERKDE